VSWLVPTPFYTEAFLGVFNGEGGTAHSFRNGEADFTGREPVERTLEGIDDFLFVPRLASSFDLTDEQTLVAGVSAAFGPNSGGEDTRTEIYGADLYWKWKPAGADAGFPFVSWQTEVMSRDYEVDADPDAGLEAKTLNDWGLYSQVLWGIKPRWVAGLRGETVRAGEDDPDARPDRNRVSPNLTWYPSEFSKLRLQYNYDDFVDGDDEHSVWLQAEFLLGAHAAHKF
jgi:hypothetical protein